MDQVKTHFLNENKLPLVIEPEKKSVSFNTFLDWVDGNREELKKNLLTYGGILFRNFPIEGVDGFNRVIEELKLGQQVNYIGGDSPRDKVKGKVYTSTEAPPSLKIPLHNEMSFIKNYPNHIYFYCDIPAATGGETIISDARKVFKSVDEKVKKRFIEKGLKYISNYYAKSVLIDFLNKIQRGHKTWMEVFETDKKEDVEKKCQESEFGYKWNRREWLEVCQNRPAFIKHPQTGEDVWFNQAHLYDYNPRLIGFWNWLGVKAIYCRKNTIMHEIFYGDGTKIMKNDLYHVMEVLDKNTIAYPWKKGDMLVLDNVLAMHGRAAFSGKRRILTAMTR